MGSRRWLKRVACAAAAEETQDRVPRDTFKGSSEDYYRGVLKLAAEKTGRSVAMYTSEAKKCEESKLLPKDLLLNLELLEAEEKLQANFCIPRSIVIKGLELLLKKKSGWGMNERQQSDWVQTLERRICNMNFQINQVQKRPTKPAWWFKLPWVQPESDESGQVSKEVPAAPTRRTSLDFTPLSDEVEVEQYTVGFSAEHQLAWRILKGKKNKDKHKDWSMPLHEIKATDEEMTPVTFHFSDGMQASMPTVTNGSIRAQQRSKKAATGQPPFFQMEHKITHHAIKVVQLVDRNLLMIIQDQDKMVCGVKAGLFDEIDDEHKQHPADHPAIRKAGEFMSKIAKKYAEGKIARTELNAERDKQLSAIKETLRDCRAEPRRVAPRKGKEPATSEPEAAEKPAKKTKERAAASGKRAPAKRPAQAKDSDDDDPEKKEKPREDKDAANDEEEGDEAEENSSDSDVMGSSADSDESSSEEEAEAPPPEKKEVQERPVAKRAPAKAAAKVAAKGDKGAAKGEKGAAKGEKGAARGEKRKAQSAAAAPSTGTPRVNSQAGFSVPSSALDTLDAFDALISP